MGITAIGETLQEIETNDALGTPVLKNPIFPRLSPRIKEYADFTILVCSNPDHHPLIHSMFAPLTADSPAVLQTPHKPHLPHGLTASPDIKGNDGRLAVPGIKEVSNFWINRKAIAQYGQQSVGPLVS